MSTADRRHAQVLPMRSTLASAGPARARLAGLPITAAGERRDSPDAGCVEGFEATEGVGGFALEGVFAIDRGGPRIQSP